MSVEIIQDGDTIIIASKEYRIELESVVLDGGIPYTGAYSAIPSWQLQTFNTSGRVMRNDFEVESINMLEVPNDAGGLTITI